ncbi:hypothetical protein [Candidatus Hecatella orcuttiae]|uniref:hypothetical protein n=1 Tax=Candidatus Hecatella orcuttiae TaxID=1935119 RepID=UPI002868103C|nr:hypothetical protein [Candidatus Hecatella orcuttiae]
MLSVFIRISRPKLAGGSWAVQKGFSGRVVKIQFVAWSSFRFGTISLGRPHHQEPYLSLGYLNIGKKTLIIFPSRGFFRTASSHEKASLQEKKEVLEKEEATVGG